MNENEPISKGVQSSMKNAVVIRLYAPLLILFGLIAGNPAPWIPNPLTLLLAPVAILCASLAMVRVSAGRLAYRRALVWHDVDPASVVSFGVVWRPFVGYLRLNRYAFPWGVVLFVLDSGAPGGGSAILSALSRSPASHAEPSPGMAMGQVKLSTPGGSRLNGVFLAALVGVLLGIVVQIIHTEPRHSVLAPAAAPTIRDPIAFVNRLIGERYAATILAAAFCALAVRRSRRSVWWAFAAGTLVPLVVKLWLMRDG